MTTRLTGFGKRSQAESSTTRADYRRTLYRIDPIWRLTKCKDNRERRLRAKTTPRLTGCE